MQWRYWRRSILQMMNEVDNTYIESGVIYLNRRSVVSSERVDVKDNLGISTPGSGRLEVVEGQVVVESVTSKGSGILNVILGPVWHACDHGILEVA